MTAPIEDYAIIGDTATVALVDRTGSVDWWLGRTDEAVEIFERLRAIRNDVGLFAEEYDPAARCMVGNFPQAFSHVAFVNTAANLSLATGPARARSSVVAPSSKR